MEHTQHSWFNLSSKLIVLDMKSFLSYTSLRTCVDFVKSGSGVLNASVLWNCDHLTIQDLQIVPAFSTVSVYFTLSPLVPPLCQELREKWLMKVPFKRNDWCTVYHITLCISNGYAVAISQQRNSSFTEQFEP